MFRAEIEYRKGGDYALSLLERCDVDRASEILEPYRGSEEKAVTDRLKLLDRLKIVKR